VVEKVRNIVTEPGKIYIESADLGKTFDEYSSSAKAKTIMSVCTFYGTAATFPLSCSTQTVLERILAS
jgi:hypothetical protein